MTTAHTTPRWVQRFEYYEKAFLNLQAILDVATTRALSDIEQDGFVKRFELIQQLFMQVLEDFLRYQNYDLLRRDLIPTANKIKLISSTTAQTLLKAIDRRNTTAHQYEPSAFEELYITIKEHYYDAFKSVYATLKTEAEKCTAQGDS